MAEHAVSADSQQGDLPQHRSTYEGFIKGSIGLSLICFFVLVALVSFRFAHTLNVFTGAVGLILGIIAVLIDSRVGGRWFLSIGLLVLFGLITAINVS